MRVRSTQTGFYCNVYIEPGHVFDLLQNSDGTDPEAEEWVPKLDAKGADTGDGEWRKVIDTDTGEPMHRDYAPDDGGKLIQRGPKRGETIRMGWMEKVSDSVPTTIDVTQFNFGIDPVSRRPIMPARAPRIPSPTKTLSLPAKKTA